MAAVVMYTKSWCPYCDRAKHLLHEKGQSWTELDIEAELDRLRASIRKNPPRALGIALGAGLLLGLLVRRR